MTKIAIYLLSIFLIYITAMHAIKTYERVETKKAVIQSGRSCSVDNETLIINCN